MRKQVLFIHSAGAQGPHEGSSKLVAYLEEALGAEYKVLFPKMPEPENPRYHLWKIQLEKVFAELYGEIILVGHSLGGSILLKYLSEEPFDKSVAGLFLVATPHWGKKDWEIEEFILQKDFASKLPCIPKIFLYHNRGDRWVPFKHLKYYAKEFPPATVRKLDGHEHEFARGLPELAEDIKSL